MYVCLCFAVSDKKIREMIAAGADSVQKMQKLCKVGHNCGACLCRLKEMISDEKSVDPQAQPACPQACAPVACG